MQRMMHGMVTPPLGGFERVVWLTAVGGSPLDHLDVRYSVRPTLLGGEKSSAPPPPRWCLWTYRVSSKGERPVVIGWQPRICCASVAVSASSLGDHHCLVWGNVLRCF